jgi:nicotinamide mononucleotide transporter
MFIDYLSTHWLEIFGVITGFIYIGLEIKQQASMWIMGFVSTAVYVFVFMSSRLYADMCLNLYYSFISIYGYWKWKTNSQKSASTEGSNYPTLTLKMAVVLIVVTIIFYATLSFILKRYTDSEIPYHDSIITSMSIVGTWMLAKKYIYHWYIWIFVNGFSVGVFCWKGLYPTAVLFLIYFILSWYGFWEWNKVRTEKA